MEIANTPAEFINTERLLLRKFLVSDIDDMLKNWIADIDVQTGYGEPIYTTKQAVEQLLEKWHTQYRWAIILKTTNENIGHVSFCRQYLDVNTAEIEYCIGKLYWGKGYTVEALKSIIAYTFKNTPINKLEAFHRIANPKSGRVLQKTGMINVPNVKRFDEFQKAPDGDICYALTKEQYFAV